MGTLHSASALSSNGECDWVQAHAALSRLARERAALDAEEGRWLLCAWRASAHVHVGYASFSEYVGRLFGYSARTTQEKLRVAEALETLPQVARALEAGALSWCAARELSRVAVADTEQAWLDIAGGKTVRELEALVASRAPGDAPDAPATDRPRPRVMRFEVAADTFATFREAMQQVRRLAGSSLGDDAVLLAMARQVLGGPRDEGRSSYQISLSVCDVCGGGAQSAAGELVPVDAAVVAMAACDAQQLGELLPQAAGRRAANENASVDAVSAAPHQSSDHAHMGAPSPRGDKLASDATPPGQAAAVKAGPNPRAKQSIPPALRRAVLTRDRRRCRVPGCTHATFVDVHHVQPRSEGGCNEASNLLVLCSAHHRATHRGELLIELDHESAFRFRHADGTAYGGPVAPRLIDAHAKVFSALRQLGFRECEVKVVLAELRADAELSGATVERLLREALCRIRPLASVKKGR
jgi:5-methylcytosine-specific restriction endonuclease McrA